MEPCLPNGSDLEGKARIVCVLKPARADGGGLARNMLVLWPFKQSDMAQNGRTPQKSSLLQQPRLWK